jgi:2-oxo-4-hydroxy-4-carboxy-5-ureidoimidazoline decarboxylase
MEPSPRIDSVSAAEASTLLMACCGSSRWVERMLGRRPFGSRAALLAAAREEWFALPPDDWREAFTHHPKIGDLNALRTRFAATRHLAEREQSGVAGAPEQIVDALAQGNLDYQQKFGFIFIVCATGRSAEEMLDLLLTRMHNDPQAEILVAAEEQALITARRLEAL